MKYLFIALAAALLFIPFIGAVHLFDWDEVNFAEAAREMIVSGNYTQVQIDFRAFWEKPPLFIWLQVLSMKIFGINEFAARFPNAIIGIATLVSFFAIGKKLVDEKFAWWWTLVYAGSWLPHFYFKSGIIDPTFNLFIFLSIYFAYRINWGTKPMRMAMLSGAMLGLAVLTKGPAAVIICVLCLLAYWIWNKFRIGIKVVHLLLISAFAAIIPLSWFGYEIISHGWWFVNEFLVYQVRLFSTPDAGHGGSFFYHWIVLLIGCFPASIFLVAAFRGRKGGQSVYTGENMELKDLKRWMWVLFWVVLILFSIVETKIVHYSSLCYFPLSFLAALYVYRLAEGKFSLRKWHVGLLIGIGCLLGILIAALPLVGLYAKELIPHIGDKFARANLEAVVPWHFAETGFGLFYVLAVIIGGVLLLRGKVRNGLLTLFFSSMFLIQVTMAHFVPKVELYSQNAAIEYFKQFAGKDVYVYPLNYHSYAHLFYAQKQPAPNVGQYDKEWLLNGAVDKPVYFICRINHKDKYIHHPNLELTGEKNGFVFFRRK
ncbi:glycosyltransferase family 39 protein [Chitinophaga horti]|uniref:Glycosyltransferase family 39 protein n=1 Tax=Chitinophaga horti TaxID=2920382 RepID=A0ABY6J111_9BACT|nr:glycosyltransferase family 39 protein [Chitinophaga horti]UYQ93348.1 glycosyltransferase family 39 protein [Chitinophaga horti]